MRGIKIPLQDFALKMQGEAYARGGAYLRDTTVMAGQANLSTCIQATCIQVTVFFPLGVQSASKKANKQRNKQTGTSHKVF